MVASGEAVEFGLNGLGGSDRFLAEATALAFRKESQDISEDTQST